MHNDQKTLKEKTCIIYRRAYIIILLKTRIQIRFPVHTFKTIVSSNVCMYAKGIL